MNQKDSTGFFTFGVPKDHYDLPHPRLGVPVILLIRKVIHRALCILREGGFNLKDASEDEVTAALRAIIENRLRQDGSVRGFDTRHFETVHRQSQVANFDGSTLTKTPDLCFKLRQFEREPRRTISEYDALFVECKPVDSKHPIGSRYCDDGLIRFVKGDYAWAMQEGMMVAYVRDGRTIDSDLLRTLRKPDKMASLAIEQLPKVLPGHKKESPKAEAIHMSEHRRNFHWRDEKGPATTIKIYHLWHDCN